MTPSHESHPTKKVASFHLIRVIYLYITERDTL